MSSIILTISEETNVQQFFILKSQIHECNKCRLAVMLTGYKLTVFCIFMDFLPKQIYIGVNSGVDVR